MFVLLQVIYYRDEEQKDMCEYQVSFMGDYETFGNSRNKCWPWGGSIATIRNKHQLKALENIARRFYSHTYVSIIIMLTKLLCVQAYYSHCFIKKNIWFTKNIYM